MKINLPNVLLFISLTCAISSCNTINNLRESKKEMITFHKGNFKFDYINNQIVLKTEFSDNVKRNLLLDLGAPISVIFMDSSFTEIVTPDTKHSKGRSTMSADKTKLKREYLHWGKIKTDLFEIENSFLSSMERHDQFACNKINGVWGANIFSPDFKGQRNKIIVIRMQDSTIAVMDSLPEMRQWIKMETDFTLLSHIKLKATVGGKPTSLYFDTGFAGSIIMSRKAYEELQSDAELLYNKQITYGYIISSLSGSQIDTAYTIKCPVILGNNISIDNTTLISTKSIALNAIGMENISRFNILVDYQKNELYLQPNPNYQPPQETFFICKGFKARNMDNNNILVINLEVNSPAEKAGIKIGDQILSINNIEADKGDNCEVVRLLSEIDGKSTRNEVTIKRDNEILKFRL